MSENDLNKLEDRIEAALDGDEGKTKQSETSSKNQGSAAGGAFLSYVISGGIFGYILDKFLDTQPWMMMAMFVVGLGLGVFHANKAMNKKD